MAHPNVAYAQYLYKLAQEIQSDQKPNIIPAAVTHEGYNFGDLVALGWAKFNHAEGDSVSKVKHWWTYTGPNSIMCEDNELATGDSTDPVEEDEGC